MTKLRLKANAKRKGNKPDKEPVSLESKRLLLSAGKKLFARKGLSGTSIRDIAFEAKMNSSQISYYFESKEGLYRACVKDIADSRLMIAGQILATPASKEEYHVRLRMFAENIFNYFIEDRDTGLILIREYDRLHSPAAKVFKNYFSQLYEVLIDFFNRAQKKNFSERRGDSLVLTSLFFGMMISELRFDHIKKGLFNRTLENPVERKKVIDQIVEFYL